MSNTTTKFNNIKTFHSLNNEAVYLNQSGPITIDRTEKYASGLRWKLGINTRPCVQLRRGQRCVYCGFLNYEKPVSPSDVSSIFSKILNEKDLTDIRRLELYVSGSFFDNDEVSPLARIYMMKELAHSDINEVVLESRPEFITRQNLESLAKIIDPVKVTIAIGVETMSDELRESLGKGFSTSDIITSINTIEQTGMNFQAYLLLNPPTINNDRRAIIDVTDSSRQIIQLTKNTTQNLTLAVQPFFLTKNSVVANDPTLRHYIKPPWLYTIATTLKLLSLMAAECKANIHIVLGNENDNVDMLLASSNYTAYRNVCSCTDEIKAHLCEVNTSPEKFNEVINKVLNSTCSCKVLWQKEIGITNAELKHLLA